MDCCMSDCQVPLDLEVNLQEAAYFCFVVELIVDLRSEDQTFQE